MKRRDMIGAVGVTGLCGAGLFLAYQLDQGNISLPGEEADLSGTVNRDTESFTFEVDAGQEIHLTVTDLGDAPYSGGYSLAAPDGTEVAEGGPGGTDMVTETHTAEQSGTFRLEINAPRTDLRYSVLIRDQDE